MKCEPGQEVPYSGDYDPYFFRNFSCPNIPDPIPVWEISLKVTFYAAAFLLGVVGNATVVLIITLNKRMRTTTNMLILNLAVSDLMVGCVCMWVHAGNSITIEWPFGQNVCKGNTFMQVLSVTSSVLTLTAISVERFFAIVYPLKARMSPHVTTFVVAINWLMSIAMAAPHLFVRVQYEYYWADRHEVWCSENWPKVYIDTECHTDTPGRRIYYTVEGVVMYFIPIVVMLGAYSIILLKMVLHRHPGTRVSSSITTQDRSRKKVIRMLMVVLTAFVICWTPQQVLILWDIYRSREYEIPEYVKKIKYAALYIAYFNSALNPVLYGGFNENFRKGFKDAFKCLLWRKRNTVVPVGTGSRGNAASNTSGAGVCVVVPAYIDPDNRLLPSTNTTATSQTLVVPIGIGTDGHDATYDTTVSTV